MAAENTGTQAVMAHATPPLTYNATLHWDGMGALYRDMDWQQVSADNQRPDLPAWWQSATARRVPPPIMPSALCLIPSPPPPAIDCDKEAAYLTFYLDPGLLLATVHDMLLGGATGVLMWVCREAHVEGLSPAVHPVLRVRATYEAPHADHVELVPHLHTRDPLRQHIVLVLQAASATADLAGHLYTEALANALAVHLLRRYAACGQPGLAVPVGLSPSRLRRTTVYIQAHLEHELPLTTLAAVAQISPAHFARLFKQATGRTPHQYVTLCRIERAKQLLAETDLPLSEIGYQVGCTDQSYFTALFRRHIATTPKAYRDNAKRS